MKRLLILLSALVLFSNNESVSCEIEENSVLTSNSFTTNLRSDLITCNKKLRELKDSIYVYEAEFHTNFEDFQFASDERNLQLLNQYLPKITSYIGQIIKDCDAYLAQNGTDKTSWDVLSEAIENKVYGTDKKQAEKRAALKKIFGEYFF